MGTCSLLFDINGSVASYSFDKPLYNDGGVTLLSAISDKVNNGSGACAAIYYAKIYDGDKLVRDFVPVYCPKGGPVRKSGMYDLVEGKFYPNSNGSVSSGNFGTEEPVRKQEDNTLELRDFQLRRRPS